MIYHVYNLQTEQQLRNKIQESMELQNKFESESAASAEK